MKYCIHCGAQNQDDALFCTQCGAQMVQGEARTETSMPKQTQTVETTDISMTSPTLIGVLLALFVPFIISCWLGLVIYSKNLNERHRYYVAYWITIAICFVLSILGAVLFGSIIYKIISETSHDFSTYVYLSLLF